MLAAVALRKKLGPEFGEFEGHLETGHRHTPIVATAALLPLAALRHRLAVDTPAVRACPGTMRGVGIPASFRTVEAAARAAEDMLRAGEPLSRIWRFAVVQMLDDYLSVLRREGVDAAARMWRMPPARTGDVRVDAAFAAMGEHLARRDGWSVPGWTRESRREAVPWWFVTELRGLHPRALVESPSSFRRRGVFITRGALERV